MKGELFELSQEKVMKALDFAYEKATNGIPGLDSAENMANDYLKGDNSIVEKVNSLIRWQNTKAATSGFITGIGGLMTLPIGLPANITSVLFVQIRMIAAIAIMGGYDVKDDRVKTLVYSCLAGSAAKEIGKNFGIKLGEKVALNAIKRLNIDVIRRINQAVGFRLLTKFGEKGLINLAKGIPLLGGVIGGSVDAISTNTIGNIARSTFIQEVDVNITE